MSSEGPPPHDSFDAFRDRVVGLAPDATVERTGLVGSLPPYLRIRVLRWLTDYFEQSTALEILEQYETYGDLYDWLKAAAKAGEQPRAERPQELGRSSRVRLRPIAEQDILALYNASFDPATAGMWRYRGRTVPIDQFVGTLFTGVIAQFMVEDREGSTLGLVTAYEENSAGQHCKIAFLRTGEGEF